MIQLKESYGKGYRLFDTITGKYVPNNAENRSRALFCMMITNEASKEIKNKDYRYSVEEIANMYGTICYEYRHLKKITNVDLDAFIFRFDSKIGLGELATSKNFEKLALSVLIDQQDEYSMTNLYDVETLKRDYSYIDAKIFGKEANFEL